MLGDTNFHGHCSEHGHVFGVYESGRCIAQDKNGRCQNRLTDVKELHGSERVPAMDICDACKKVVAIQKDAIERGGIAWQCKKCRSEGALLPSEGTQELIDRVKAANCLGVTWGTCPVCDPAAFGGSSEETPDAS